MSLSNASVNFKALKLLYPLSTRSPVFSQIVFAKSSSNPELVNKLAPVSDFNLINSWQPSSVCLQVSTSLSK